MSTPIKLERATLISVEMKRQNGMFTNRLKFSAVFDRAAAKAIGAEYTVFDSKQEIRTSYTSIKLDYAIKEVAVYYAIPKLEDKALDIRSHGVDTFELQRKGDGKKKAQKLMVTFRITHYGDVHALVDWWLQYGGREGMLQLTPQQAELPLANGKPESERREVKPRQMPIEAAESAAADSRDRVKKIIEDSQEKRGPGRPKKVTEVVQ